MIGQERSSFSAKACTILQALRWSQKHRKDTFRFFSSLRLLLCSCYAFLSSVLPSILLSLAYLAWQLSSLSSSFAFMPQGVSGHSFLPGNDTSDKLARWVRSSTHSLSQVVSLSSRIHSFLGVSAYSHKNSSTKRFPQYSPRNLCFLVTLAVSSLVSCNKHSLFLHSYLSIIGGSENPLYSTGGHPIQDIAHLILHCSAVDSAVLAVSLRPLLQVLRVSRAL